MMFFQHLTLGLWGVTVGTYLAANTGSQGTGIFSSGFVGFSTAAGALGSIVAPVLIGFVSDRYVSAQYLLTAANLTCAISVWGMYQTQSELVFFCLLLAYYHGFIPAVTLTNKIGLRHLKRRDAEYPIVRSCGTLGWIMAGLFVGLAWPMITGESIESSRTPLLLGACAHVLMALLALTLPATPPERWGTKVVGIREAMFAKGSILGNRPLVVFLFFSILASLPSMAYNNFTNLFLNRSGFPSPAALMTVGQTSEMLFLLATPLLLARMRFKTLFALGIVAWTLRYSLLAIGSMFEISWPTYVAILLHGPCYTLIYIVGVMYVDKLGDPAHRGAAQGFHAFATTGMGHLLGALTVGMTQQVFLTPHGVEPPPYQWVPFWLIPAAMSLVTAILFMLTFSPIPATPQDEQ
ncbi:MFS transporter [Bythopirellula goksoeyrii]|uniref:Nucleoside transporter YegT n=1 Tax=Bythopirellula goksoeyrii TaxID=1400387 RepID=A0A5B9QAF8_9BACT|nr:MFS transporter [Bythopirellula goksoeyrii]QEG33876.1 Putative nucleoside transporter YegT [Bythopirellula goksoeyrii]